MNFHGDKGKALNYLALGLMIAVVVIVGILSKTVFKSLRINFMLLILFLILLINMIFSLIIIPSTDKKLFHHMGMGVGWTLNPRNIFGLIFYLSFLGFTLFKTFK